MYSGYEDYANIWYIGDTHSGYTYRLLLIKIQRRSSGNFKYWIYLLSCKRTIWFQINNDSFPFISEAPRKPCERRQRTVPVNANQSRTLQKIFNTETQRPIPKLCRLLVELTGLSENTIMVRIHLQKLVYFISIQYIVISRVLKCCV